MRVSAALVFSSTLLLACGPDKVTVAESSSGSDSATGTDAGTSESGSGESTETGASDPCDDCSATEICVADCSYNDFGPDYLTDFRCVEHPACLEAADNPECVSVACGFSLALEETCGTQVSDPDLICDPDVGPFNCDPISQDCSEDKKCVPKKMGWEELLGNQCVPVSGAGVTGDPCSSEGLLVGVDDCDENSLCLDLGDELQDTPFEGTCHRFCNPDDANPCPDGQSCTGVEFTYAVCV